METLPRQPSTRASAENFSGDVWFDTVVGEDGSRVRVAMVRFAPHARTRWHTHALGQTLHVTEGVGLVQTRGGQVVHLYPGDTVYTPPGEWHWHGGAPGQEMTHLAMWEVPEGHPSSGTTWGDVVTDREYGAR